MSLHSSAKSGEDGPDIIIDESFVKLIFDDFMTFFISIRAAHLTAERGFDCLQQFQSLLH